MVAKALRGDWPKDGLLWQVQGFGETRPSATVPTDLTLEVLLRWIPEPRVPAPKQLTYIVETGIGQLPALNVGQRWKDQRPVSFCDAEEFDEDVLFSADNWRHIEAGEVLPGTEMLPQYLIPPHVHGFAPMLWTKLLAIGHNGHPDVILIPELEVARAWYLRSTDLALRITAGPLRTVVKDLCNPSYNALNPDGDWQTVVRTGLSKLDAMVVSMLRCDPLAARRAARMMDSQAAAGAGRTPYYMEAEPPLDGERRLRAEGIWFESGGVNRFLVYRLTAVPFPLHPGILRWDLDNSNQGVVMDDELPEGEAWPKRKKSKQATKKHNVKHGSEPDSEQGAVHETVIMTEFLDPPQMERLPPRKQTTKGTGGYAPPPPSSGETSTGQGENVKGSPAPHRIHEDRKNAPPVPPRTTVSADFPTLLEIQRLLNTSGRASCTVVEGSEPPVGPSNQPRSEFKVKNRDGSKISWALVGDRPRQFMVLQLEAGGQYAYAIELERRPKKPGKKTKEHFTLAVAAMENGPQLEVPAFTMIAAMVAKKKGVWPRAIGQVRIRKLPHSYKDNKRFANAVIKSMHKLLPHTAQFAAVTPPAAKSA